MGVSSGGGSIRQLPDIAPSMSEFGPAGSLDPLVTEGGIARL